MFKRAVELQQAGKTAEAIAEYLHFLALHPDNVEARSNLGAAFAAQGRYLEAIEQYGRRSARGPANPAVRFNLGIAHYKAGDCGRRRPRSRRWWPPLRATSERSCSSPTATSAWVRTRRSSSC